MSIRIAFVVPRFGESIAGGAETLIGALAQRLVARGDDVTVLTTCAKDNRSWGNEFPPGPGREYGVSVLRFPVSSRDLDCWAGHQIALSEGMSLSTEAQFRWLEEGVNSAGLYQYIVDNGPSYDLICAGPYLFSSTFYSALIYPERSVLLPCLHDEVYAYVPAIGSLFRQVRGCIFNAAAERDLARSLYGPIAGDEVGMGFEAPSEAEVLEIRPYFTEQGPYLLYLGRKETGKNVQLLVDYFIRAKDSKRIPADLRLVIVGAGSFDDLLRPAARSRADIIDLLHVSDEEKRSLIRHAVCLVQPSVNESFSIVIMESWLLEVPVLVHARCAVTRDHVRDSGGGLYFGDELEFAGVVSELMENQGLCRELGQAGARYVRSRYSWPAVLGRFDRVLATLGVKSGQGGSSMAASSVPLESGTVVG